MKLDSNPIKPNQQKMQLNIHEIQSSLLQADQKSQSIKEPVISYSIGRIQTIKSLQDAIIQNDNPPLPSKKKYQIRLKVYQIRLQSQCGNQNSHSDHSK